MTSDTFDPVRVLIVASHPTQYSSPQFRRYEADARVDLTVAYCSFKGAEESVDRDFGVPVRWDVPLLEGHRWTRSKNRSPFRGTSGVLSLMNPDLWRIVRRGNFEIVICYGYGTASTWVAALATLRAKRILVLSTDAHSNAVRGRLKLKSSIKRWIIPRVFGLANGVLAPSTRTKRYLESLGVPPENIYLTPYVVDNAAFTAGAAQSDPSAVRAALGIPAESFLAIFVGKLARWKRPLDLLEAAALVRDMHVLVVGDGELRGPLMERARRSDLVGRVHMLGFMNQTKLPSLYRAADVLVLPSEYEPFGVVVNEAFASGIPAIVTDACGAAGDLVRDGETGYVVHVGDTVELAKRLGQLETDRPLRRRLTDNAASTIDRWGPQAAADAFVNACIQLARRPGLITRRR